MDTRLFLLVILACGAVSASALIAITSRRFLRQSDSSATESIFATDNATMQILHDTKIRQNRQWAEGQPCPSGWLHFNDSCYWGSIYPLSWFAAEHECRSFGYDAHLASVHGFEENTRVQAMAGCSASWIGLTKLNPSQTTPTVGWAWTDMSDNDYVSWREGYPIGVDERNCAYQEKASAEANGNGWSNGYCTELRQFACKADAKINAENSNHENHAQSTTESSDRKRDAAKKGAKHAKAKEAREPNSESPVPCPDGPGWVDGKNGYCYYYSADKANWFEADARCRNLNSTMLSIKSELEQRMAMLGGCDKRTWLGAVRWQPEERWHWYDDMSYVGYNGSFTNWAQSNIGANYVIAFIDTTGNGAGRWYDTPSAHEPMYYICKQSIFVEEPTGESSGSSITERPSDGEGDSENEEGSDENTPPEPDTTHATTGPPRGHRTTATPESIENTDEDQDATTDAPDDEDTTDAPNDDEDTTTDSPDEDQSGDGTTEANDADDDEVTTTASPDEGDSGDETPDDDNTTTAPDDDEDTTTEPNESETTAEPESTENEDSASTTETTPTSAEESNSTASGDSEENDDETSTTNVSSDNEVSSHSENELSANGTETTTASSLKDMNGTEESMDGNENTTIGSTTSDDSAINSTDSTVDMIESAINGHVANATSNSGDQASIFFKSGNASEAPQNGSTASSMNATGQQSRSGNNGGLIRRITNARSKRAE